MNLFQQYLLGIRSFFEAIPFLFKHRLAAFLLVPILFNIVLFGAGWMATSSLSGQVWELLESWMDAQSWEFWGAEFLTGTIQVLLWLIFRVLFFLVFSYAGGYLVLIFLSPVLAYLSERTERILSGTDYPFDWGQFTKDIVRGAVVALRNLWWEILWAIGIFILAFIPVVGFVSPFLLFAVSAYYYGFSFLDYNLERRRMNMGDSIRFVKKHKAVSVGLATPFTLLLLFPVIGPAIGGFAAIVGTVGGTIAHEKLVR